MWGKPALPCRPRHCFSPLQAAQVRRSILDNGFHAEEPRHRGQFEIGDQLLVEAVVAGHAAADYLDEVVPISAYAVELRHFWQALHMLAKAVGPGLGMVAGADHDEHGQVQSQFDQIDLGPRAANDAAGVQALQPAPAGVLRQADAIGQLTLRQRAVLLQAGDNIQIKFVYFFHLKDQMTQF